MNEKPVVKTARVVTRGRREEAPARGFQFTKEMLPASGSEVMEAYRQKAWEAFESLPMPSTTEEAWRRTDLKELRTEIFRLPGAESYLDLPAIPSSLLEPIVGEEHGGQILLLPGNAHVKLNANLAQKGVIFTDWQTALTAYPELVDRIIGKVVKPEEGKFGALAAALGQTGVVLYVPRGLQVELPLHSLLWSPGNQLAHLDHVLVWVDEGASVTYIHESSSPTETEGQILHSGIVEIHVGAGASLRFVELQSFGENVWNFTHERAQVSQNGTLEWIFGAMGSHLTKNFSDVDLVAPGATGKMSGFYFTDHDQHLDHDTQQNHLAPNTTSDLLFKGALLGRSRSVWQGMIYVAPGAMKTDGYQANRNLVLSKEARADSIPGLEILADDVRCTHGATVGKIDPEEIFYLMARGIPEYEARRLVVEGFFDPIMQRIPFEGVRGRFQQAIHEKMGN